MRIHVVTAIALLAWVVVACAGPVPTSSPVVEPTPAASPSASVVAAIPIRVRFAGRVNCNIGFSSYCSPYLSVLAPGARVAADSPPAVTDPLWDTRGGGMQDVKAGKWTLLRGTPAADPGEHLLVISLIGASDVVSFNPDGSVATELLARCTAEVDIAPHSEAVDVLVTFVSEPDTTVATCTVEALPG